MVCIPANIPGIYCGGWAIAWWRPQGHAPFPDMCDFKIDSARLAFFDMCGVPPLHGCTLEKHIGKACTATFNVWVHPTPRGWGVGQGIYLGPQTGHWYIPVYTGMYTIPVYTFLVYRPAIHPAGKPQCSPPATGCQLCSQWPHLHGLHA